MRLGGELPGHREDHCAHEADTDSGGHEAYPGAESETLAINAIETGEMAATSASSIVVDVGPAPPGFTFAMQAATGAEAMSPYWLAAKADDERQANMELGQYRIIELTSRYYTGTTKFSPGAQTQRR